MPFRGGIFMPVSGRYFHAVSGRYFHAVLRRYFHAVSGRYFHAASGRYFYAASGRRNGKTAAPVCRPQTRGAGGRGRGHDFPRGVAREQGARAVGREDRISRRSGAPPANKGARLPGERRYSHAVSRRYFHARFGAVFCPLRGGVFMSVMGGETAKRPRRCAARKQGARAAGRGGMIFRAAKIAREQGARAAGGA